MRIRPILFNGEMVRAILDGRKTCTRRVVKPQWNGCDNCMCIHEEFLYDSKDNVVYCARCGEPLNPVRKPPYRPGDIMYVRETYIAWDLVALDGTGITFHYCYRATDPNGNRVPTSPEHDEWKERPWIPSIHMRKEAARIWLRVTDVRLELLQDITPKDAKNEGVGDLFYDDIGYSDKDYGTEVDPEYGVAKEQFAWLWDSTIKKSALDCYGWDANPWVWVIEFERCEKPEDSEK